MAETKIIEGVVEAVSSRTGKSTKGGNWTVKNFKIDGEWYGGYIEADNKAKVTKAGEGDTLLIKVAKNAKGFWNWSTDFKILKEGVKVASADGATTSIGAFTREYGMALGKASGLVQGLAAAGKITTVKKAGEAVVELGQLIMSEVWLATPESLGLVEEDGDEQVEEIEDVEEEVTDDRFNED